MAKIVALLDSMWGWGGYNDAGEDAPRYFRINPDNHSGRNLYRLCGDHHLLVSNCCRTVQHSANHHGAADASWVKENLGILKREGMDLLLVCGRVARETFAQIGSTLIDSPDTNGAVYIPNVGTIRYYAIDHPAARRWSKEKFESTARKIEALCQD